MIKPNAIPRLRAAAELRQALVERDTVRESAPHAGPVDVTARLRINDAVHTAALRLIDANRGNL